ncbi:hypothetical protein [Nonomuraea sp. NPDC050643]|uniref:hypothetical protein n=1 Tax=Nonomuraea sp. NPDC050643 TaxID=3155660 RepID=UPI0033CCC8B0
MSLLEQRYRSVLRLLPASYRAEREEEMVAAFMELSGEVPDELNAHPRWGEVASVLALSVRVRLGASSASPRSFAWGEAVRLVALLGLAFQSLYAVFTVADLFRRVTLDGDPGFVGAPGSFERLLIVGGSGMVVCSAFAFIAIMQGRAGVAKIAAVLGVAPVTASFLMSILVLGPSGGRALSEAGGLVFTAVPVIALLLGFHGDVPPRRRSWALTLAPLAAGVVALGWVEVAGALRLYLSPWLYLWLDLAGMTIPVWAAASVALPARRRPPSAALAMSAFGLLLLADRLPLLDYMPEGVPWAMACAQCVLLGVLAAALAWAGVRALPGGRAAVLPGPDQVGERSG